MQRVQWSRILLVVAGLAVVAAIVTLRVPSPHPTPQPAYSQAGEDTASDVAIAESNASEVPETAMMEATEEEEEESGMNPEEQPRTFYVLDFQQTRQLPAGFLMSNVVLTERGIELARNPGDGTLSRMGVVESPTEGMDFPSNALCPLWKEELPEGAKVEVEVAVSPDGIHWGDWHPVEVDDDAEGQIRPHYPDGRPNPNYGFTPGGMMFGDTRLFNYFRFRFTLLAEGEHSPVLSGFRMFYQDSTLGKGRLADFRLADDGQEDHSRAQ